MTYFLIRDKKFTAAFHCTSQEVGFAYKRWKFQSSQIWTDDASIEYI